jgi:hypothetical protein
MVKNKFNIHKVVLLHIPGLDPKLFNINLLHPDSDKPIVWTEKAIKGAVTEFQHLKAFFDVMNVMRVGGDKSRIFSPVESMLYVPLSNSEKAKKEAERRSSTFRVILVPNTHPIPACVATKLIVQVLFCALHYREGISIKTEARKLHADARRFT